MRRVLMQRRDAGVIETLRDGNALAHPGVPLDQRPADQTVRDHDQSAVHGAAAGHNQIEGLCDAGVKRRPIFAVRRHKVGCKRIFRQFAIGLTAQVAKVALLDRKSVV